MTALPPQFAGVLEVVVDVFVGAGYVICGVVAILLLILAVADHLTFSMRRAARSEPPLVAPAWARYARHGGRVRRTDGVVSAGTRALARSAGRRGGVPAPSSSLR